MIAAMAMLAAVIAGIWLTGTPMQQRAENLDARRVRDLSALKGSVERYWKQHESLPHAMDDLDVVRSHTRDPVSGEPYTYLPLDSTHYKLCAHFETATNPDEPLRRDVPFPGIPANQDPAWRHPKGTACFERHVKASTAD